MRSQPSEQCTRTLAPDNNAFTMGGAGGRGGGEGEEVIKGVRKEKQGGQYPGAEDCSVQNELDVLEPGGGLQAGQEPGH